MSRCHSNVIMSGDSKVEMSGTLAPPRHGRLDGDRHESAGVASRGGDGVAQVWADEPSGGGTPATAHDAAGAPPTLRRTAELCWRNASLPFTAVERPRRAPAELTRQEVTWPRKWRSISTPRANHPWKTTPIGPRSPKYVNRGSINDLGPDISTLLTPDISTLPETGHFYFALTCSVSRRVTATSTASNSHDDADRMYGRAHRTRVITSDARCAVRCNASIRRTACG